MPISATRTRPQCIRPGSSKCAGLRRKNVTVSVARTATPMTAPVVPLTPLGRSTLRTGAPLALIASIMSCGSPFTGRLRPAPNSASMISAGVPIAWGLNGSTGYFQPRAAEAASPCRLSRSHSRMTETSRPRAASSAAATKPSPPLLPRPATTRIGPSSTRSIAASATAWPGAQHQREAGRAGGDGQPVGTLHLSGGQNFHAKSLVQAPYPEAFPMPREAPTLAIAYRLICLPIS